MAMTNNGHGSHVQVPRFHVHSPHLDWHEVEHPLRMAMAAVAVMAAGSLAAAGVYTAATGLSELPVTPVAGSSPEAAVTWPERELPREWRWERKAVSLDHMYGVHARGPAIDDMVRRPR